MNIWYIYSLCWLLALGLGDYTKKLVLSKWWDKEVYLFMCFVFYIIALLLNFILNWDISLIDSSLISKAGIMWFFDFLTPIWLLASLKYVDSSLSFISIRFTSSVLILFIWIFFLWDTLSLLNYIWFWLWIIAVFLLSWVHLKEKIQINKKWIFAIIITIFATVCSNSYFKYIVSWVNIDNFMILKFSFSFFFIFLYILLKGKLKNINRENIRLVSPYAFFSMIFFISHFLYFLPNMYLLWAVSLSYKILSFSLIVPIFLSIIFLWEKLTKTKIIAFILTIISLLCFIN